MTDVQLRPVGLFFGSLAVLSTAIFQIWQGTKQKEYGVSAMQLQSAIATWQALQSFGVAAVVEFSCLSEPCTEPTAIQFFQSAGGGSEAAAHTLYVLKLVLGTCFLALMVNFCSFGLIGRTSPITFQVVGHAKTCLVLAGGYLFFPMTGTMQQLYNNIMGVSVAMVGVVLYGHIKHASGQSEVCLRPAQDLRAHPRRALAIFGPTCAHARARVSRGDARRSAHLEARPRHPR